MAFGLDGGTVSVLIPDAVRYSTTAIFFTELILVFAALGITAIVVMSTLHTLLGTGSYTRKKYSLNAKINQKRRDQITYPNTSMYAHNPMKKDSNGIRIRGRARINTIDMEDEEYSPRYEYKEEEEEEEEEAANDGLNPKQNTTQTTSASETLPNPFLNTNINTEEEEEEKEKEKEEKKQSQSESSQPHQGQEDADSAQTQTTDNNNHNHNNIDIDAEQSGYFAGYNVYKSKRMLVWTFVVYLSSLTTSVYFLLIYTNMIAIDRHLSCTTQLQLSNCLLIASRFCVYMYWNENMVVQSGIYLSHMIFQAPPALRLRQYFPSMKRIMRLKKQLRRAMRFQHHRNASLHEQYTSGEQYLHYRVFKPLYIQRFCIFLWMAIYLCGVVAGVQGEQFVMSDGGLTCKETFDATSFTIMFYTFGALCDVVTPLVILDKYIIQIANVMQVVGHDASMNLYRMHIYIISEMRKHLILVSVSIGSTLVFRVLSFLSGLEATFYPLNYTINVFCVFLLCKFNLEMYDACCHRNEVKCFRCCIGCCGRFFCRIQLAYSQNSEYTMQSGYEKIHEELNQFYEEQEMQVINKKSDDNKELLLASVNARINERKNFLGINHHHNNDGGNADVNDMAVTQQTARDARPSSNKGPYVQM